MHSLVPEPQSSQPFVCLLGLNGREACRYASRLRSKRRCEPIGNLEVQSLLPVGGWFNGPFDKRTACLWPHLDAESSQCSNMLAISTPPWIPSPRRIPNQRHSFARHPRPSSYLLHFLTSCVRYCHKPSSRCLCCVCNPVLILTAQLHVS